MIVTMDGARWGQALVWLLAYAAMCGWVLWRHRRAQQARSRQQGSLANAAAGTEATLVAYASQTGQAEQLAWRTAELLHLAGASVRVCALDDVGLDELKRLSSIFLIASTYGEGDPPDNGARFADHLATDADHDWSHLRYGLLALGDRHYAQFCGFGRALDDWLGAHAAQPLFPRVDVDQMHDAAITTWFEQVAHVAGVAELPAWQAPGFDEDGWQLAVRRHLNPGSPGEGVFHLELAPVHGAAPQWEAGDLVQVRPPLDATRPADQQDLRPREYSIASIPRDARLHLLVRLRRLEDGGVGRVSGWLCEQAPLGQPLSLRVHAHSAFRVGENTTRPLLLIGNGTGMAGLRAHIKARAEVHREAGPSTPGCWLVFGERLPDVDLHHRDELAAWQAEGVLQRLDAVFSRCPQRPQYVQDRLRERADEVRQWVGDGAAIYVCGSLAGMAAGVDEALRAVLGDVQLDQLARDGRYRRDVY